MWANRSGAFWKIYSAFTPRGLEGVAKNTASVDTHFVFMDAAVKVILVQILLL